MHFFQQLAQAFSVPGWLDPLLAPRCALCGVSASGGVCLHCSAEFPRNIACCGQCSQPLPKAVSRCGRCLQKRLLIHQLYAPFRYQHPIDLLIVRFKKTANLACGQAIAQSFAQAIDAQLRCRKLEVAPLFIPVPAHPNRLRKRGFDPAWLLCRQLKKQVPSLNIARPLLRVRDTPSQGGLSRAKRQVNVRAAFVVDPRQRTALPDYVTLIDDVATTASTLNACALALRRAGVKRVDAWVIARA